MHGHHVLLAVDAHFACRGEEQPYVIRKPKRRHQGDAGASPFAMATAKTVCIFLLAFIACISRTGAGR